MNHKAELDKKDDRYPWTARQRRQKKGRRKARKETRVQTRNL